LIFGQLKKHRHKMHSKTNRKKENQQALIYEEREG